MNDWQNVLVIAGALAFFLFLLWKYRPTIRPKKVRALAQGILEARAKAQAAKTPRERAEALCQAGDLFAEERHGTLAAVGHYLRALRADPGWLEPVQKLRTLLWKERPKTLERILWRRLGQISWQGETRPVAFYAIRTLAELYRGRLRDRMRARALDRLLAELNG